MGDLDQNKNKTHKQMKRYYDLTKEEKLNINESDLSAAIKVEAIQRGIKPPITLDQALAQTNYKGFTIPPDAITLYEIVVSQPYSSDCETGIAFRTVEEARKSIEGAMFLTGPDYTTKLRRIAGAASIREVYITCTQSRLSLLAKVEEEDLTPSRDFQTLADECMADLGSVMQDDYNAKLNTRKRAEYISLANGDEEIAKQFWSKIEKTIWPTS